MSAPTKQSRWGSFLSQAVAGVEARLDNILAEDEEGAKQTPSRPPSAASASSKPAPTAAKTANDRLQERLARAVAAKNAAAAAATPSPRTEASPVRPPRTSADFSPANQSPRPSSDVASVDSSALSAVQGPGASLGRDEAPRVVPDVVAEKEGDEAQEEAAKMDGGRISVDSPRVSIQDEQPHMSEPPSVVTPSSQEEVVPVSLSTSEKIVSSLDLYEKRISELERSLEVTQVQHQEELHGHVEQVDALQAKLQYLARETTEAARKDASAAPVGSLEKKLAEKDQQVAQLMGEGQKLAGNEQKLRAVIKKLRLQIAADEKELNEQRIQRQKAETELSILRETSRGMDDLRRAGDESQKTISQFKRDLDRSRSTVATKDMTISELKTQLQEESERAKRMAAKVSDQVREAGHQKVKELEDVVAALEVEKNRMADRAKAQTNELREKAERAAERSRAVELEMKGEVQVLESKLETLRATAEEASSGAVGDAQAKLLRQIETLQTQYSIASENWQGMEASLAARAANLEKERDEALRRESDMRKKARESAARVKRQEEELDEAKTKLPTVQRDLSNHQIQLESLRKRAEEAETALAEAKTDFEKQRLAWKEETIDRSGVERRPWLDEVALRNNSRPASPLLSAPQRTYSGDFLGLQSFPTKLRKSSAPSSNSDHNPNERPASGWRPSQQPSRPSIFSVPTGQFGTPPSILAGGETVTSPTHPFDREDMFESVETPISPQNVLQDMVSVSTIAAGPSVQLVERMSAAIRRLESEKVGAREELARISGQRDEARAEIVTLMKEVDSSKSATKRVENLEKEVTEINERYQTTLEMLGEKSELVEELRADVDDVKAMYRDLVERTIK
ncbi:TATA element modulatory factor 1 TATA binding-domain-containing protein [Xylariales sp. AK1849]|nr:TATA element modulatory factor 1 TATA binding-domain-containing protein [Xylariales sp. AK1849]